MEYAGNIPEPISQLTKQRDENMTLWVTQNGEFLYLPTETQAKKKSDELMETIDPKEWWCQKVSKFSVGIKDHLCAYIKRDYSKEHDRSDFSNVSQDEMWIGRITIGLPLMATDTRERSRTAGQRVPLTLQTQLANGNVVNVPVLGKKGFYSYHPTNSKEVIDLYKSMCGSTAEGAETQYLYILLNGGRNVTEDDESTFWLTSLKDALAYDRNQKKEQIAQNRGKSLKPSNLV